MNFRLRVALWFALSVIMIIGVFVAMAHWHLDEELRQDRWDRSHPKFPNWVIHGSYTDAEVQDILGEMMQVWLWVGVPMVAASLVAGYFIAARAVRPVREINRALAALDSRSVSHGLHLTDNDPELAVLVQNINGLLARVGASYNEMAEFSARVAHELRTPLTLLRMRVEAAAAELPADFSEDVQDEIGRLSQLVERALLTAKAAEGRLDVVLTDVNLSGLVADLEDAYTVLAEERGMEFAQHIDVGLSCRVDADLLRQILHNLLGNAVRHGAGTVRVRASRSRNGRTVVLSIANRVDPGRDAGGGVGIGLRLVRSLAAAMDEVKFGFRLTAGAAVARLVLPTLETKRNP